MADFNYAKGRIEESIEFITREMEEFEKDYTSKNWEEYKEDNKLQKLIDRTVENILTALIEISGTVLVEEGISGRNYSEILNKIAEFFSLTKKEQYNLSTLAVQRNRLAHRYLNLVQHTQGLGRVEGLGMRLHRSTPHRRLLYPEASRSPPKRQHRRGY